ncbi:MAG: uridine kinase [Chloroflexota bacterium]|jgi:uridine kinase
MKPIIIGIAGGSGSGKTTLTRQIIAASDATAVSWIPFDAYYRDLAAYTLAERQQMNFDHPDAFDTTLCLQHLDALAAGTSVVVPEYDFAAYTRAPGGHVVHPQPVIIVDGILLFVDAALRERFDLRIYIDADDDIRLLRRMLRDTQERGRDVVSVCQQYLTTVRPMHQQYVAPSRVHAHLIIPSGDDTQPAIQVVSAEIQRHIERARSNTAREEV